MPKNLGRYTNNEDTPRKKDIDAKSDVPTVNTTTLTGTVTPDDNTLYKCTITSAITITANAASICPTYGSDFIITIGSGGSVTLTTLSVTGDDISTATTGNVWEINILCGRAIVKILEA